MINQSPWLKELKKKEEIDNSLKGNIKTHLLIIGGGIAGISTAYFLLKNTQQEVVLVEGSKVAHGATGHNAGQIVSYYEKPFWKIVDEYGLEMAISGQKSILSGWGLLETIYKDTGLQTPFSSFQGYSGHINLKQIKDALLNKYLKVKGGIKAERIFISRDFAFIKDIPKIYSKLYEIVEPTQILDLLETNNKEYICAVESRKGCMNSALFTEELAGFLLKKYPTRFKLYENIYIDEIKVGENILCKSGILEIESEKIVLCTNGFEHIHITDEQGEKLNTEFHKRIEGVIGYMSGYIENSSNMPTAVSYYDKIDNDFEEPYFYMTRRKYEFSENSKVNLVCVGGPEIDLQEKEKYLQTSDYPAKAQDDITEFLQKTYKEVPNNIEYKFNWHGLMGYTNTRLRIISKEPSHPNLLYNLGCNGVGILPSIYGGKRISQLIKGKKLKPSIFDL